MQLFGNLMALITNLLMFQPIDNLLMKIVNKIFYFFLITVFLFFVSCSKRGCTDPSSLAFDIEASKDDGSCTYPENSKKTLVFNSTGTWCQHCGGWGKNFSNNLSNNFPNVQIITLHNNDNFSGNDYSGVFLLGFAPSNQSTNTKELFPRKKKR